MAVLHAEVRRAERYLRTEFPVLSLEGAGRNLPAHDFVGCVHTCNTRVVASVTADRILVMLTNSRTAQAAELAVHRVRQASRDRTVCVDSTRIPQLAAVAGHFLNQRVRRTNGQTTHVRRAIAERVCCACVEVTFGCTAGGAATTVVREQLVACEAWTTRKTGVTVLEAGGADVLVRETEHVVVRRQAVTNANLSKTTFETNPRFATEHHAAVEVAVIAAETIFELKNSAKSAAQRFRTTEPEARRMRRHAVYG